MANVTCHSVQIPAGDVVAAVHELDDLEAVFEVVFAEEDGLGRRSVLQACARRAAVLLRGGSQLGE